MTRLAIRLLTLFALVPLGNSVTDAGVIAYESFSSGSVGQDLIGQTTGQGFARVWTEGGFNASVHDNYDIAGGSLAFGSLTTSGNKVTTAATSAIAGARGILSQTISGSDTFYMSMLIRPEGTVGEGAFGGFFGVYLDSTTGTDSDVFIGKGGVGDQYVIETRGGSGRSVSNYEAVSGQTRMLVLKAELQAGLDTFTLWIDRELGGGDPSSFDARKSDLDVGGISSLVLYSTGAFSIDEIRFGDSYADVTDMSPIPEPGGLALLLAGSGSLWMVRRRKSAATSFAGRPGVPPR